MNLPPVLARLLPCLRWLRRYDQRTLTSDLVAALIVTIMLIPQSLAYALLAGLPPETGLYASILPLVAYAMFGTSMTMAVGPVAVVSLMTAAAAGKVAATGAMTALEAAILLAWISGAFLLLLGVLRAGFFANFLSHPVVAGFITASGIIIALSQLKHLLGIKASGDTLPELAESLFHSIGDANMATMAIGGGALLFLLWARSGLKTLLKRTSLSDYMANVVVRIAPVIAVVVTTLLAWWLQLDQRGVSLMGAIPSGLPQLQLPDADLSVARQLLLPAVMLSIIGYVESVSVGRTLAARRRQKIDADQELIGLGAANIASGLSGGFPVTGGFSRSVVNFDAGAQTPAASFFTAIGIAVATLLLTGVLAWLPNATLAATIIIAVLGLVDLQVLQRTWQYALSDFIAVATTMLITLLFGVEIGVSCGVGASLLLHLHKTSRPHIAEVGEVPGTEHFRNVQRHQVLTHAEILSLRVDARLYFANASYIEDKILGALASRPQLKHVILMCTAVNEIDISALEVLEDLNERLREAGIGFHLSEVKGPVMDALKKTHFVEELNGQVFLTQHQAVQALLEQRRGQEQQAQQ
jgi:SulP family sulfate permease